MHGEQNTEISALRFEVLTKLCAACLKVALLPAQKAAISPPRVVNRVALNLLPVLTNCFITVNGVGKYVLHQLDKSDLWQDPLFWENAFFHSVGADLVRIYGEGELEAASGSYDAANTSEDEQQQWHEQAIIFQQVGQQFLQC